MSEEIRDLVALVGAHHQRLEVVYQSLDSALDPEILQLGRTPISALIIAGLLENYYTCLDTIYLRISQSFEITLDPARRHNDLLQKMTLEVAGVRIAAVSEEAFPPHFELLKFRHYKRCYFELEYDWDRLDFLVVKLRQVHPPVRRDLDRIVRFARSLDRL